MGILNFVYFHFRILSVGTSEARKALTPAVDSSTSSKSAKRTGYIVSNHIRIWAFVIDAAPIDDLIFLTFKLLNVLTYFQRKSHFLRCLLGASQKLHALKSICTIVSCEFNSTRILLKNLSVTCVIVVCIATVSIHMSANIRSVI